MVFLRYLANDVVQPAFYASTMCTKKISGSRIKARREELGLTLADVCLQIEGLIISRLSNWEHGRNMISVDEAKKLAVVLEMPVAYLLTIEEEDRRESAGPDAITQEFTYVYNACSDKGKEYLERAIGGAKRVFMEERRGKNKPR